MKTLKTTLICLIWSLYFLQSKCVLAQDYHFSQFYAAPLSLNPALTGNFQEDYRLAVNYRTQWKGLGANFETMALGADMNFKGGRLKKDWVGAGVYCYRDNLGDNIFTSQAIILSGAYHHPLDVHKRHKISGGLQAGYVQKSLNYNSLSFSTQYEDFIYRAELASGEVPIENQVGYMVVNLGAYYSFRINPKTDFYTGLSVFQLNNPKERFFSSGANKLNSRYSAFGGMNYRLTSVITISPKILYMNQQNGVDFTSGGAIGYDVGRKKGTTLYAGAWYRWVDAAVLMAGVKWKNYTLRFSYDATVSSLKQLKKADNLKGNAKAGALEVSLILTGRLSRAVPDQFTIPCGIF